MCEVQFNGPGVIGEQKGFATVSKPPRLLVRLFGLSKSPRCFPFNDLRWPKTATIRLKTGRIVQAPISGPAIGLFLTQ